MSVNPSGGDGSLLELSGKLNSLSFFFSFFFKKNNNFKLREKASFVFMFLKMVRLKSKIFLSGYIYSLVIVILKDCLSQR